MNHPCAQERRQQECDNSQGISLQSIPGKVFNQIYLNEITERVDEVLREN